MDLGSVITHLAAAAGGAMIATALLRPRESRAARRARHQVVTDDYLDHLGVPRDDR